MAEIWTVSSSEEEEEPVKPEPRRARNILQCNLPIDHNKRKRHEASTRLLQSFETSQPTRTSARTSAAALGSAHAHTPEKKARSEDDLFVLTPGTDAGPLGDAHDDGEQRARREQMSKLTAAFGGADNDDDLDDDLVETVSPTVAAPKLDEEDDEVFDIDKELATMAAATKQHSTGGEGGLASDAQEGGADGGDLVLKAQCKSGSVKIRIGAEDTFEAFLQKLKRHALEKQWARPGQVIRVNLDGDEVNATDTPETHGLEGGEVLDVVVQDR